MARQNPSLVKYPQDGWLKGYFWVLPEAEILGGSREPTGVRKNLDCLRLRDFAIHLLDPKPGMRILDVGCADGVQMVYCGLQGATVYGQDLSPNEVVAANEKLSRFGIIGQAVQGDAVELKFPKDHFDAVISSDFFEHIPDSVKVQILKEIWRVLKPGGVVVIKTPNLAYLRLALFYKRLKALTRLKNPFKITIPHTPGTDDPQHVGLTTRWKLICCICQAGFLNYQFFYPPLRRFGPSAIAEALSTEVPILRDMFCEDVVCKIFKPIGLSYFPD